MSAVFSIFGFLSVIPHGLDLIAQTVLIGSVVFLRLLALPLAPRLGRDADFVLSGARRVIQIAALAGLRSFLPALRLTPPFCKARSIFPGLPSHRRASWLPVWRQRSSGQRGPGQHLGRRWRRIIEARREGEALNQADFFLYLASTKPEGASTRPALWPIPLRLR